MSILDDISSAAYDIMAGRIDWDALYKACEDETVNGNGEQFINVSQFTC